jgi:hypothetical protein
MSSVIGIKVADGEFFPILADDVPAKKRLVLTTAHDGQANAQIDFYKTSTASLQGSAYIGTLLVENIVDKKKGEPSIEVLVSVDGEGEFSASAYDVDSPEDSGNHVLTVSLTQHDEKIFENIDFEENDVPIDKKDALNSKYADVKKRLPPAIRPKILIFIGIGVLALLLTAFCLWIFVFKNLKLDGQDKETVQSIPTDTLPAMPSEPPPAPVFEMPNTETETASAAETPPIPTPPIPMPTSPTLPMPTPPTPTPPTPTPPTPTLPTPTPPMPTSQMPTPPPQVIDAPLVPVTQQPASRRDRPPAPVSSYKVPAVIPADGVAYKIRWGDTLWDISQAFYRTPLSYSFLARYNGIRNPDRIVAGRTIRIPPLPK